MIILNGNTHILQCVMSGAAATTNPDFWASWVQVNSTALVTGDGAGGTLNGNTDVALITGIASRQLKVASVSVYNRDTAAVSLTFKVDVSGTDRYVFACILQPGESVTYNEAGWAVTNTSGYFLSTLGAAGSNTQIQYNNSGSMGANAGLTFNASTQLFSQTGSNPASDMAAGALPSAPSSGNARYSVKSLAGRPTPFITGSSGVARALEYFEATGNKVGWQSGPTSAGTYFGLASGGTNAGTAGAVVPTLTNKYTMMAHSTFASVVTTQNQQVGIRTGNQFFRGNAAGLGGFFFICRFGFDTIKTSERGFVGLVASASGAAIVTGDPSALTNMIGFAFDVGDSAWTFMHNDGSGTATKDAISGQTTLATNNTGFDAYIFCYPNDTTIYYRLDDVIQGTTLCDTSTSSDLPVNTTALIAACVMSNGTANTTAGDATIGVNRMTLFTER
jgi:hypothetical protein